jgi:hypothetical protein
MRHAARMAMTLHYGETSIRLKDEVNIDAIKDELELAVRNRGGWVRVEGIKREVHVFVSAGQYISLTPTRPGRAAIQPSES